MKKLMFILIFLLIVISGCKRPAATDTNQAITQGNHEFSIKVNNLNRNYILHVPPQISQKKPLPLVFIFHGGLGDAASQQKLSNMDPIADREGFITVYPQGYQKTWNAGICCGRAVKDNVDDVAFISLLIDDISSKLPVNPSRIYATGHSNGAMLSYKLACQLSNKIAAIAPVAAPMGITDCNPSRPVSVMHFHGTADLCAPYNGGEAKAAAGTIFPAVKDSIDTWKKLDGCSQTARETYNKGDAKCMTYSCKSGSEVTLCTIQNGGHAWPDGTSYPAKAICGGDISRDISASEEIWKFFSKHPLS